MQQNAGCLLLDKKVQTLISSYVPSDEILQELVGFFSIFSDLTRLKMVSALAISEMCVSDISKMLNLNQTTVSHQLRLLRDIGVVKYRRQGKIVFYTLKNEIINEVLLKGVEFLGY
jgi:ArsR family transcriptional regulator